MLKKRILTSIVGIPLIVAAVWFDEPLPWFTIFMAVWGLLAAFEFYKMVAVSKIAPLACLGLIWTLLFFLRPHFERELSLPLLLTSALVLSMILLVLLPQKEGIFITLAWTIAGVLYAGWLLSYWVTLRLEAGRDWVFLALFTTFASDTAAFFVGRALGRHRLAPRISPAKTWEGAVGGACGAVIVSLIIVSIFNMPISYAQAVVLGLLVSVFAQFGDLAESLLKRNMGIKEASRLLPGHGGILDRTDSLAFAGVVVYYFFLVMH